MNNSLGVIFKRKVSNQAKCLVTTSNKVPDYVLNVAFDLPGQYWDLDTQCKMRYGPKAFYCQVSIYINNNIQFLNLATKTNYLIEKLVSYFVLINTRIRKLYYQKISKSYILTVNTSTNTLFSFIISEQKLKRLISLVFSVFVQKFMMWFKSFKNRLALKIHANHCFV